MNERVLIDLDGVDTGLLKRPMIFDTNIWLMINGPYTDVHDVRFKKYSKFYADALRAGARIFLPQMVAGEFINRSIRWQANAAGWDGNGKIHRQAQYHDWLESAADDLYHIVESCEQCDDVFSKVDIDKCLKNAGLGSIDFNDVLLSMICQNSSCVLVTDDADYSSQDLPIFSANRRLFAAS